MKSLSPFVKCLLIIGLTYTFLSCGKVNQNDSCLGCGGVPGDNPDPCAQGLSAMTRPSITGQVHVLTQHNDNGRTGANLNETILNTSNVNVQQFGKLFSRSVDGYIYAQPLYVSGVDIPNKGARNVVYVVTERNNVYAFDADDPDASEPYWQVNLGSPVPNTEVIPNYGNLAPEIGITSTPVIDIDNGIIYVVAFSKNSSDNIYHHKLHALDLATGIQGCPNGVEIGTTVRGNGGSSVDGQISFNPLLHLNRPGLLLSNGIIYVAFGSHADIGEYQGWVFGYDAKTLQQVAVFNTAPDGRGSAVWHSGQGLAADAGNNVYLVTGNGTFSAQNGGRDFGNTAIKFSTSNGLSVVDWFTPYDVSVLNARDHDLGSSGPLLLPGTSLMVIVGKDRILRLLDTNNMGRFDPATNRNVQEFPPLDGLMFGAPIYWDGPTYGPAIYLWASSDYLKVFRLVDGKFQFPSAAQGTFLYQRGYSPPLSLSANGKESGTGIIWATGTGTPEGVPVTSFLRAVDASDVTRELWNSGQNIARDDIGVYSKFCPITVVNGKVYVPTFSNQLHVFGLLPLPNSICSPSLSQVDSLVTSAANSSSVRLTVADQCAWSASSNADWISITSGREGRGGGTITYSVDSNPNSLMRIGTISIAGLTYTVRQAGVVSTVSAASFEQSQLASESVALSYGAELATRMEEATSCLPTSLAGTSVVLTDSAGTQRLAPLFSVSPTQVTYLVPRGSSLGEATVKITSGKGHVATGTVKIDRIAPGLFSTNVGDAIAVVQRVKADNSQSYEPAIQFDSSQNRLVTVPIDLGPDLGDSSDRVYLILFGTGLRFRQSLADVRVEIGGIDAPAGYAGAQQEFNGLDQISAFLPKGLAGLCAADRLDQINVLLPRSLAGSGEVGVGLTVEGKAANTVRVSIK